jgi:hypothetical protein
MIWLRMAFIRGWIFSLLGCLIAGCSDSKEINQRLTRYQSSDARHQQGPDIHLYLPNPQQLSSQQANAERLIDSYYLRLEPQGEWCQDERHIEILEPFEADKKLTFTSYRQCDYGLELLVGKQSTASTSQALSSVNYEDDIAPLVAEACVSCHPDYETLDTISAQQEDIVFQVENQLMPPNSSLSTEDVATFLAWRANGFPQSDPTAPAPDSTRAQITVFYRNNLNTVIQEYMLLNVPFFVYEDSLWLQESGELEGFETIEWPMTAPESTDDNSSEDTPEN